MYALKIKKICLVISFKIYFVYLCGFQNIDYDKILSDDTTTKSVKIGSVVDEREAYFYSLQRDMLKTLEERKKLKDKNKHEN